MSPWLLMIVSLAYVYTGIEQGHTNGWAWMGFWSSYASANIFYIMAMK